MKFRVNVDLMFSDEEDAKEILNILKKKISSVYISKEEPPVLKYHKCFHDESPTKPCKEITSINVIKEKEKLLKL